MISFGAITEQSYEDGTFRVRVFSRTNEYDITNANQSQTTSGVGIYYKKEFSNWKEFITPKKKLKDIIKLISFGKKKPKDYLLRLQNKK